MAKGKSSASSATRKKHARKAAAVNGEPVDPQPPKEKRPKGDKKGKKNKEPKKKAYIPPVKPVPVHPDPLDTLGIAQRIPADLLVVLRLLAKKDSVTKRRALEELQVNWVEKAKEDDGAAQLSALTEVLPVWCHHIPTLFLHPSRRIRLLAVGLHISLLKLSSTIVDQFFFFLHEVADADQAEYIIGAWCMTAHDADRQVSAFARESWDRFVSVAPAETTLKKLQLSVSGSMFRSLWDFTQRVLLDPAGVYAYVNPPQPVIITSNLKAAGKGSSARARREDDPPSRSGREEEEESEGDQNARLRIGSFGVAEWLLTASVQHAEDTKSVDSMIASMDNIALWSSLYHGPSAPFLTDEMEAFGYNQPGVRKAAWALIQVLLQTCKSSLSPLLPTLSNAVLRSAWVEPDPIVRGALWQPLLTFLKGKYMIYHTAFVIDSLAIGFPSAWQFEATNKLEADDESNSEDEDIEVHETPSIKPSGSQTLVSHAYKDFLQFLELGCMGSAVQGYPAIIIILSTVPPSIMASVSRPLETLLTSFWAAVDGRALSGLDRTAASAAFLSSLLECTRFLARRLYGESGTLLVGPESTTGPQEIARQLVSDQAKHTWEELCSQRLKVEDSAAADTLAKFFANISTDKEELFDIAWNTFSSAVRVQLHTTTLPIPTLISPVLSACTKVFAEVPRLSQAGKSFKSEVIRMTIERFEQMLEADDSVERDQTVLDSLVGVLDTFGKDLFVVPELASVGTHHISIFIKLAHSLQAIDRTCLHHVRRLLTLSPAALQVYLSYRDDEEPCTLLWEAVLREIAHSPESLEQMLPPLLEAAELDKLPGYLQPSPPEMDDVAGKMLVEALNGRNNKASTLMKRLLTFPDHFISPTCYQGLISSLGATFSQHVQGIVQGNQLDVISLSSLLPLVELAFQQQVWATADFLSLLPNVFIFAFILPLIEGPGKPDSGQSEAVKVMWRTGLSQIHADTKNNILVLVKQILRDLVPDCSVPLRASNILGILVDPTLGITVNVLDDIFPQQDELDAMLHALPTSTNSCLAVNDPLVLPGESNEDDGAPSPAYDFIGYTGYSRIVNALLLYFLDDRQTAKENIWALRHFLALAIWAQDLLNLQASQSPVFSRKISRSELEDVVSKARRVASYLLAPASQDGWLLPAARGLQRGQPASASGIERLLHTLVRPKTDCARESRILHVVLQHILSGASKEDADEFVQLARGLEKKAPHASLAVALSTTRYAPEPPRLERYRNELAAGIFGVPAAKANTEGLWLLRQLIAIAPDPESDIVYLPVPRAVNLMKSCQQWITSDEDLDEEVEAEMTSVFLHLAPILQNVSGSHWDLIFDVMENNLENCSFDDAATLPMLARTLRLLIVIQDLVSTNKALRAAWDERKIANLSLVRDLVAKPISLITGNVPLSICRELALTIVQDLPDTLLDKDTLSKMCHILTDPSDIVQKMAYKMLRESAAKYTEHLVLEAAVDSEAEVKLDLPRELVELLHMNLPEDDVEGSVANQNIFGYLLSWMLTFDLFTNASLRVKSGYLDHLRQTDLITDRFIPSMFGILRLYDGLAKAVKLDIWAVDEYFLESLLQAELSQVKDPDAASQLSDDNMKVKVANAVNEITASYTIDEQELEVRLKLPSDWPLHTIEIKEGNRVGVSEDRWRSWILGMQQILTFRVRHTKFVSNVGCL
ncbi:hypothetical protein EIP86_007306 [Pleurotus ostreatoroseus]|nr:hypothetical protein EIP86_007306 [Pleurotus ostreatoroseus]